ncbi:MAG: hypothetical protein FJX31_00465 [Alphaproteobacteria bacterium]|nr:hypothetical protein [Alphaproteobacteria bacterium]
MRPASLEVDHLVVLPAHCPTMRAATSISPCGAGKIGMDARLWLLQQGAVPSPIRLIVPRDSGYLDRAKVQE